MAKTGTRPTDRNPSSQAPGVPGMPAQPREPRLARIARRAHDLYLARGGRDGRALDDWLQAEREIDAEMEREAERAGN